MTQLKLIAKGILFVAILVDFLFSNLEILQICFIQLLPFPIKSTFLHSKHLKVMLRADRPIVGTKKWLQNVRLEMWFQ